MYRMVGVERSSLRAYRGTHVEVMVSCKENVVSRMCQRFWGQLEKEEEDSWEIRIRMTLQLCRQHS